MTSEPEISVETVLRSLFARQGAEARALETGYVGRWTRVVAEVRNVYREAPSAPVSVFAVRKADPRAALVDAGFLLRFTGDGEKIAARNLHRRESIDAIGRIDECAEGIVILSECRFAASVAHGDDEPPTLPC